MCTFFCIVPSEAKKKKNVNGYVWFFLVSRSRAGSAVVSDIADWDETVVLFTLEKLTVFEDVREGEGVHGTLGFSSERKVRIVSIEQCNAVSKGERKKKCLPIDRPVTPFFFFFTSSVRTGICWSETGESDSSDNSGLLIIIFMNFVDFASEFEKSALNVNMNCNENV